MKWVIFALLLSAVIVSASPQSGSITLLALMENGTAKYGNVASLGLELQPGTERVFLETFPMTKVTTQASLRFAQQIACNQLDMDCSEKDFLFSIQALPGIVGGPSAGGAAALLTSSLLLNKTVPHDIAMTGTINSGGIIGPVGGLKYKVEAAAGNGIKTVLLPKGTKDVKLDENSTNNETIDLIKYGESLNLTVIEVATLGEVLELALGIPQNISNEELLIEGRYQNTMAQVANELCQRSKSFMTNPLKTKLSQVKNFTDRAERDLEKKAYYAAASYCFRANVEYKRAWYDEQNLSKTDLLKHIKTVKDEAVKFSKEVEQRNVSTLTDIQTFMAVMERIDEAFELAKGVEADLALNHTDSADNIGFAEERLFSALTWSRFFDGQDKIVAIDKEALKSGCAQKISEAEERYNYVKSVLPEALDETRADIDKAYNLLGKGKYIMCLYGASKAKAEADVLLSVMGVEENRFDEVIQLKLNVTRQALMKAQRKNIFPIIAYSYYEYADSLRDFDRISSLLFTEYALELANLDIYFEAKPEIKVVPEFKVPDKAFAFLLGFGLGGIVIWIIALQMSKKRLSSVSKFQTLQAPPKRRLRGKKR